jgi:Alginate lyase/Bacterial Ig domain
MMQPRKVSTSKSGKASSMLMLALLVFVMRNPLAPSAAVAATSIAADNAAAPLAENTTLTVSAAQGLLAGKSGSVVQSFTVGFIKRPADEWVVGTGTGAFIVHADGSYSFTPGRGVTGVLPIKVTIRSAAGVITEKTLSFKVTAAPITARDDHGPAAATNPLDGVLANDTVPDGESLGVVSVAFGGATVAVGEAATIAGVGTLTVNADGTYHFVAAQGYTGAVPVATITVRDHADVTATEHLTIDLTPPPPKPFVHDGGITTLEQSHAIAAQIAQGNTPQAAALATMRKNKADNPNHESHPVEICTTGKGYPKTDGNLNSDNSAASLLALDWRISGDTQRADAAVRILNAWSRTLKGLGGDYNKYLMAALQGSTLAATAETLRNYSGWAADDQARFKDMLLNIFAPMNQFLMQGQNGCNWVLGAESSLMAIGIFTDRRDLYDEAKNYYLYGKSTGSILNATPFVYADGIAQWAESGRDQAHTVLGIGCAINVCKLAVSQGDDLFSAYDNRLLGAIRYALKYNIGDDVPFTPYVGMGRRDTHIGAYHRGDFYADTLNFAYNHYVVLKGENAPELKKAMTTNRLGNPNPYSLLVDTIPTLAGLADDRAVTAKGGTLSVAAAHGLFANDHGPAGDKLTVTQFSVGGVTAPAGKAAVITEVGSLTVNADGSYAFNPVAGFTGAVPIATVTVSEAFGVTATETLLITVTP